MAVADVAANLAVVRERIARAGGDVGRITVVAVTKGFGPEAVRDALAAGLVDVGENYAQQLRAKATAIAEARPWGRVGEDEADVRWHLLGRVQRNKVRSVAPLVHLWQGVDRPAAGSEIAGRSPGAHVLVQVNLTGEPQKAGCRFEEAPGVAEELRDSGLDVCGLMGIGPAGPPEDARGGFRRLRELADRLGLGELSMGMSDDLEVAVQEGSTMVRIGRALFGPRPDPARVQGLQ